MKIGVYREKELFRVNLWAPFAEKIEIVITSRDDRKVSLEKSDKGYWRRDLPSLKPGDRYFFIIDGEKKRPDPASFSQPDGVHEASSVVDHEKFIWTDGEMEVPALGDLFIYELHIGAFTEEGTFDAAIGKLEHLKEVGVNAIEVMPVAQFPGSRNWGYDGVYPFSVQNSYGGVEGFKRFVNEAHKKGFSVLLDVVYNHLGPEGNYLRDYGPYFTDKYKTPWGEAVNFDDAYSDEVRNYFIENARYWAEHFHIDGFRLDAVHSIFDMSACKFLEELKLELHKFSGKLKKDILVIAESDLNDARLLRSREDGGYGLDAAWCDDFHHALHAVLTGEKMGYYADFGTVGHLAGSFSEGYVYTGQYSSFRKRKHGNSSKDISGDSFIVYAQNHDQVGNRIKGRRLAEMADFGSVKIAASCVMLSAYVPLIFMGEELAEKNPFMYFVSHNDPDLIEAVRRGRKEEFSSFEWQGAVPDPSRVETFEASKLSADDSSPESRAMKKLYSELFVLRKRIRKEKALRKSALNVRHDEKRKLLFVEMKGVNASYFFLVNFSSSKVEIDESALSGEKLLDTSLKKWCGEGSLSPDEISKYERFYLSGKTSVLYEKKRR